MRKTLLDEIAIEVLKIELNKCDASYMPIAHLESIDYLAQDCYAIAEGMIKESVKHSIKAEAVTAK